MTCGREFGMLLVMPLNILLIFQAERPVLNIGT